MLIEAHGENCTSHGLSGGKKFSESSQNMEDYGTYHNVRDEFQLDVRMMAQDVNISKEI